MINALKIPKDCFFPLLTGSLCVCSCLALSDELENLLGHLSSSAYLQPKGLSPVCERWWILRFSSRAKERVHPSNCEIGERQLFDYVGKECNFLAITLTIPRGQERGRASGLVLR